MMKEDCFREGKPLRKQRVGKKDRLYLVEPAISVVHY